MAFEGSCGQRGAAVAPAVCRAPLPTAEGAPDSSGQCWTSLGVLFHLHHCFPMFSHCQQAAANVSRGHLGEMDPGHCLVQAPSFGEILLFPTQKLRGQGKCWKESKFSNSEFSVTQSSEPHPESSPDRGFIEYLAPGTCHCVHTGGESRWNLDGHSVQPQCVQAEAGLSVPVPSLCAEPPSVPLGPCLSASAHLLPTSTPLTVGEQDVSGMACCPCRKPVNPTGHHLQEGSSESR